MHVAETDEKAIENARQFTWMQGEFTGLAHPVWSTPSGYSSPEQRRGFVEFSIGRGSSPRRRPSFEEQIRDNMIIAGKPETVIAKLRFESESPQDKRDSVQALWRQVGESAIDVLGPLEEQTIDGQPLDADVVETMKERIVPRLVSGVRQLQNSRPDNREQVLIVQRRYLDALRDALIAERSIGAYSSETYRQVESMLDAFEQRFGVG